MPTYNQTGSGGIIIGGNTLNFVYVPPPDYTITRVDDGSFQLSWVSHQPGPTWEFFVYREGVEIADIPSTTNTSSILLSITPGEQPFLEVLDLPCQNPQIAFPGSITLNWLAIGGAASYLVQEYTGAAWSTLQTVLDDGSGVFIYKTPWLADESTNQFQIVPVDAAGNNGTPIAFTVWQVRHPDLPNTQYGYSASTHKFTLVGP